MILSCGRCHAQYDVSDKEPGAFVSCTCGDVLVVPQLDCTEAGPMISKYVQRLAADEGAKLDSTSPDGHWEFRRGSARIEIAFDPRDATLTIESAVMPLPADAAQRNLLFARVLELNHRSTGEARFATRGGELIVTFTRDVTGLDYVEFVSAVASVSRTSDDYDDELRATFLAPTRVNEDGEEEVDLSGFKTT